MVLRTCVSRTALCVTFGARRRSDPLSVLGRPLAIWAAKAVQEIEKAYLDIIQLGAGEYGLAALVDLGGLYENLATTLRTAYAPPKLTADQVELYKMWLEDKAYPNEEKAVQAYSQALGKSYELNLYNENTAKAVRQLGVLRPFDYPGLSEDLITPVS